MENNGPKLVCRKCQGPHLTIKCGKESVSVIENKISEIDKPLTDKYSKDTNKDYKKEFKSDDTQSYYKKDKEGNEKSFKSKFNDKSDSKDFKHERRPLHKVKMSNLPVDMTEEELNELLYEWGHVVRMRLLNYETNSTAYIEFKDKEAADYIVEALNKTPFEHIMLDVERLYD